VLPLNRFFIPISLIGLFAAISNLLTLILSKAVAVFCRVFCPQIIAGVFLKDAIGLILLSYRVSL